jgi:hypothetical protein
MEMIKCFRGSGLTLGAGFIQSDKRVIVASLKILLRGENANLCAWNILCLGPALVDLAESITNCPTYSAFSFNIITIGNALKGSKIGWFDGTHKIFQNQCYCDGGSTVDHDREIMLIT